MPGAQPAREPEGPQRKKKRWDCPRLGVITPSEARGLAAAEGGRGPAEKQGRKEKAVARDGRETDRRVMLAQRRCLSAATTRSITRCPAPRSCSQIRRTSHPWRWRLRVTRRSLRILPSIFRRQ